MTAAARRHLTVVADRPGSPSSPATAPPVLVPALDGAAVVPALSGDPVIEAYRLRLPGVGGRFLVAIAQAAAAGGWQACDTVALVAAIEERSCMWVIAPTLRAMAAVGPSGRPALLRRRQMATFEHGRWQLSGCDIDRLRAAASAAPGAQLTRVAVLSGRRVPNPVLRALELPDGAAGRLEHGLAAALRTRWAAELLIAPAITRAGLGVLRDRVAGAPRCGWCRTPVLGVHCPRCTTGAAR